MRARGRAHAVRGSQSGGIRPDEPSSGRSAVTASTRNSDPTTAAASTRARSSASRASMRADGALWRESGSSAAPPSSSACASRCSTKRGLPWPRPTTWATSDGVTEGERCRTSARHSRSERATSVTERRPAPHASPRARAVRGRGRSSGASRSELARYSSRSRSVTLAQWMSSSTTTTGRRRASVSSRRRTAHAISPPVACPRPRAASRARATALPSGSPASASASRSEVHSVPNASTTTSRSGRYKTPSPYGRHRPRSTQGVSTQCRDELLREPGLACPAAPLIVTSAGTRCSTARVYASRRSASSRSRADERHVEAPPDRVTARRDVAKVVGAHRLGFALQPEGDRPCRDGLPAATTGRVVEHDAARLPLFLAGGRRALTGAPASEPTAATDHDLARRDPDSHLELERCERLRELDRGAYGAKRIVLARSPLEPEGPDDRIAREIRDDALVALDRLGACLDEPLHQRAERLCVEPDRLSPVESTRSQYRTESVARRRGDSTGAGPGLPRGQRRVLGRARGSAGGAPVSSAAGSMPSSPTRTARAAWYAASAFACRPLRYSASMSRATEVVHGTDARQ